ncbi:MAG TPA: cupin domain-containing protein [Alphaproteobacteria bacterium]|jgi:quercetin dioxygenase-like cupin family protein|nr:cupin domain-containing protein [Alphaproteobacteria bacterium]
MKFRLLFLPLFALAAPAIADVTREPLATYQLQPGKSVGRVEVKKLTIAPGGKTGLHTHPGPVVSYVVAGTLIVQVKGEAEKIYRPGDAIFEPGNTVIEKFDNGSATEPAVFIADYLLGADDKEIIHFVDKPTP